MTLPVKISAYGDESVRGYMWRVATCNGYQEPKHLFSILNLPHQWSGRRYYFRMIEDVLMHMPAPEAGWIGDEGDFELYQREQSKAGIQDWWIEGIRICPLCLVNGGYIKKDWEIPAVTVCNEHRISLIHRCPSCTEPLTWHHSLRDHCSKCGERWREIEFQAVEVPAYQAAWQSAQDKLEFREEFTWGMLQAYRPRDLEPTAAMRLDISPDILPELCRQAWSFMSDSGVLTRWQSRLLERFDGLRLNAFEWFDPETTPGQMKVYEFQAGNELLPRHQRNETNSSELELSVKAPRAAKLLGLESLWKVDLSQHNYDVNHHTELRDKVLPSFTELGIRPVKPAKKPYWTRFWVKDLDAWVRRFQKVDPGESRAFIWLKPGSRLLELHDVNYLDLLGAGIDNQLTLYRQLGQGINPVGVEKQALFDWLKTKLTKTCEEKVSSRRLARMLDTDAQGIQALIAEGLLKRAVEPQPTRGPKKLRGARQVFIEGESVKHYYEINFQALVMQAM